MQHSRRARRLDSCGAVKLTLSSRSSSIDHDEAIAAHTGESKMAKEGQISRLDALAGGADAAARTGPAPVHLWNPPFCGDIDMRIAGDGTWNYLGTPIRRPALVRLFASVLRREGDNYFLVTPVEKVGIKVEEVPFLAVELTVADAHEGRILRFRTNVDEWVDCGPKHALRFEVEPATAGLRPYLHVRHGLWAKVTRALLYDLAALGEEQLVEGTLMFGVASMGTFFPMAAAESARDFM